MADAHAKAAYLARLAGVELGQPLSIVEHEPPWAGHDDTVVAPPLAEALPQVSVSTLRSQLTVEIAYQIASGE